MSNPIAHPASFRLATGPMIWSNADRVVACDPDGSIVGTFATVSEAERALAGMSRGWLASLIRRPRYARNAA